MATESVVREMKSGGTGIVLSFFWTGLGQLYAGSIARGLIMMILTPFMWAIGWFGGFAAMLGGLGTLVAPNAQESAKSSSFGVFGFVIAMTPVAIRENHPWFPMCAASRAGSFGWLPLMHT